MRKDLAILPIILKLFLHVFAGTKKQFTLFTLPLSWNEARSACLDNGMILVEIADDTDLLMLQREATLSWSSSLATPAWIGLFRPNETGPVWDQTCLPPINSVLTSINPVGLGMCVALSITGALISVECDASGPYVCQQLVGECTYVEFPLKGCSYGVKTTSEVIEEDCKSQCLTEVFNGFPCWAAAHLNGYAGDDCWKFFDSDPNICYTYMGNYNGVILFIRECFDFQVNSTLEMPAGVIDPEPVTSPCYVSLTGETTLPTTSSAFGSTEEPMCQCPCSQRNLTALEIEKNMWQLSQELYLNKKDLSIYKRKFYSVKDDRVSAQSIGYIGALCIVGFVLGIILMDLPRIVKYINFRKKR